MEKSNIQENNTNNNTDIYIILLSNFVVLEMIKTNTFKEHEQESEIISFYHKLRNFNNKLYKHVDDNIVTYLSDNFRGIRSRLYFQKKFGPFEFTSFFLLETKCHIPSFIFESINNMMVPFDKLRILSEDNDSFQKIIHILLCFRFTSNNVIKRSCVKMIQYNIIAMVINVRNYVNYN